MRLSPAWLAAGFAALALAIVMTTVIAGFAVQRRTLGAPYLDLRVGPLALHAFITDTPQCRQPGGRNVANGLCSTGSLYSPEEYYAVWLVVRDGRRVTGERRLFYFALEDGPPVAFDRS